MRPKNACLMMTADLERIVEGLEENACEIKRDDDAGTVEAFDDGQAALRAMQKGREPAPWIVMFYKTDHIDWS